MSLEKGRSGKGHVVGRYIQSPPMLFTRDGHNIFLGDQYRGCNAFLILGGRSFLDVDHSLLKQDGVLTMGVNNVTEVFSPNLWVSTDDPTRFDESVWLNPTISKFIPMKHKEKKMDKLMLDGTIRAGDCPNTLFYRMNYLFNPETFLLEDTFCFGNTKKNGDTRSVMLVAIRMLYFLGIRNIFLLGCDFNMERGQEYAACGKAKPDNHHKKNMGLYVRLSQMLSDLAPHLYKHGLQIFNCNPKSNLKVFPIVSLEDALSVSTQPLLTPEEEEVVVEEETTKESEGKKLLEEYLKKQEEKEAKKEEVKKNEPN